MGGVDCDCAAAEHELISKTNLIVGDCLRHGIISLEWKVCILVREFYRRSGQVNIEI